MATVLQPSMRVVPDSVSNSTAPQRRRALPVPPEPVMDIEGGPIPVTDPGANVGGDQLSPTTLVLNYLKQRGYQPSSENIRRALEANARDPGVIPGLRSDTAGTDSGGGGGRRAAPYQSTGTGGPDDKTPIGDASQPTSAPPTQRVDPIIADQLNAQSARLNLPTPAMPNTPPQPGVPVAPEAAPVPSSPLQIALDRATGGTPELPAPPTAPQISAPPEVPALPAPPEMLRLPGPRMPAIEGVPPQAQLPAPPRQITGPAAPNEAPVADPNEVIRLPGEAGPVPQGNPGARVVVRPKIAPGPRVQGAPIEQTPMTRAIPRIGAGVVAGAARGGVPGAIVGGVTSAAPEIADLIRNLHLY